MPRPRPLCHNAPVAWVEPDVGTVLGGRYRLVRAVGRGGMGAVWEAVQEGLGRRVAVKVLHPMLAERAELLARFKREAETTARLGHPNIVQVSDFAFSPEQGAYLVMELLEGETLGDCIAREGPLPWPRVVGIARQVLDALVVAHDAGIVHRDLKPANMFLVARGIEADLVKVLDFGVARLDAGEKLTATGTSIGTPLYMSPEQVRGQRADARADVWAVGVTMYEMLAGRPPFGGNDYAQLITAILSEAPEPLAQLRPDVPPWLIDAIAGALERDLDTRIASARELMGRIAAESRASSRPSAARVTDATGERAPPVSFSPPPSYPAFPATAVQTPAPPRSVGKQQISFDVRSTPLSSPAPSFSAAPPSPTSDAVELPRRSQLPWILAGAGLVLVAAGAAAAVVLSGPLRGEQHPETVEAAQSAPAPAAPGAGLGTEAPPVAPSPPPTATAQPTAVQSPSAMAHVPPRAPVSDSPPSGPAPRDVPPAVEPASTQPAPAPEEPAPAPATATRAELGRISGTYDSWVAETHLRFAHRRFETCLASRAVPVGEATFTITVGAEGRVTVVTGGPPEARACLFAAVRAVAWTESTGPTVQVTYRLFP